ncbi:hypothetical protein CTI12_AA252130 [Artemisia annua]|uniref:Uncharacterized protein n=1 Tax=Artemisia annua TaxID=35608 RepID=A0A2U1NL49_ARTAN|nr:hypothetical protein CTI12_AA252130 [Artemisia annua]
MKTIMCEKEQDDVSKTSMSKVNEMMMIHDEDESSSSSSSSSSSIGEDSDLEENENDEVESSYNNENGSSSSSSSFDDAIQALEQALPIRRGISTFYNGKSKSFTSLADATSSTTSSIQEIAKPENAYTRKRRNYGAFKLSNMNTGGISKKPKTTMLRLTLERNNPNFVKHGIQSQINKPLALRSFSMVNLHRCNPTKIGNC